MYHIISRCSHNILVFLFFQKKKKNRKSKYDLQKVPNRYNFFYHTLKLNKIFDPLELPEKVYTERKEVHVTVKSLAFWLYSEFKKKKKLHAPTDLFDNDLFFSFLFS